MNRMRMTAAWAGAIIVLVVTSSLHAWQNQPQSDPQPQPQQQRRPRAPGPNEAELAAAAIEKKLVPAITRGIEILLSLQEGDAKAEWPYEGVYRVGGQIPIGYRVGGTGICATALILAPGFDEDTRRQEAIRRAARFVIDSKTHELMSPEAYDGGYDVRGWGYTYGLSFLLLTRERHCLPEQLAAEAEQAVHFFIKATQTIQIPQVGGWNYARPPGRDAAARPSPFMTGPTLQVLFEAKRQGFEVDEATVNRALDSLEKARTPAGSFQYVGASGATSREPVPGATGRMLVGESTLLLAGRSSAANVRGALDAFFTHWSWLDKRRAQQGTHVPPYNIAPYYYYYAHYYAAQAIELLPRSERREYRRRLYELLFSVQLDNGSWNDRVFPRSANFGTAMSVMAMMMPQLPPPARWGTAPPPETEPVPVTEPAPAPGGQAAPQAPKQDPP